MRFVFRKYRKTDRGKIQNILIDKKHLNKYTLKPFKYKIASFLGVYRPYTYLIEEKDSGGIIAMGILVNKVDYGFWQREWWIEGVRVADKQKRSGWGTLLLKNLIHKAKKKGARKIFLNIESDNLPAHKFFSKLNFKPVARIFTFFKPPFVSFNNLSSNSKILIAVKLLKKSEILRQNTPPIYNSHSDKLIELYRKIFTLLRVVVTKGEEIVTTSGTALAIAFKYYFFKVRIKIILKTPISESELKKIILYQFSRFAFSRFREIIIDLISLDQSQEKLSLTPELLKVSSIEDLMVFESPNSKKDTR